MYNVYYNYNDEIQKLYDIRSDGIKLSIEQ